MDKHKMLKAYYELKKDAIIAAKEELRKSAPKRKYTMLANIPAREEYDSIFKGRTYIKLSPKA